MNWGKKIIEWSASYAQALEIMIYLNNQYGLDGRNPNSWTGILWCFGLHDRPWSKRAVFGTIRFMSGESLSRKRDVSGYIERVTKASNPTKSMMFLGCMGHCFALVASFNLIYLVNSRTVVILC